MRGGRTALTGRHASAPFGAVRAFYPDGSGGAEVQITNPAGGILGGDRLGMYVSLGTDSRATIVTQGAGKAYLGPAALQESVFEVGEGAVLEYLPHHVIPYAASSLSQRTEFRLAKGATLIAWDAFSAGRIARGERFAFDALSSVTLISRVGVPEIADGFHLTGGPESFGGYPYMGTVYVLASPSLGDVTERLAAALDDMAHRSSRRLLASASEVGEGCCVVRILSDAAPALYDALNTSRCTYREQLGYPPPSRGVH